jgi:toxin ParE1/3/4
MPKYLISEKALEDLEDIWNYTFNQWSREQANLYLNLFFSEFENIAKNPNRNKIYSNLTRQFRASVLKSHLIFYLIEEKKSIEIIRILHKSMDLDEKLK